MGLNAESINRDQWRVFDGKRYLGYIWRCIVKGETIFFVGREGQAPECATVCRSLEKALEHMGQMATAASAPNADDVDALEHVLRQMSGMAPATDDFEAEKTDPSIVVPMGCEDADPVQQERERHLQAIERVRQDLGKWDASARVALLALERLEQWARGASK